MHDNHLVAPPVEVRPAITQVETVERVGIIRDLRPGEFDVLVVIPYADRMTIGVSKRIKDLIDGGCTTPTARSRNARPRRRATNSPS